MSEKKEYTSSKELIEDAIQKSYWREVAIEFHFDKPFHQSMVEAISERLQVKFKLIKLEDKSFMQRFQAMADEVQKHMNEWDIEARKRAAQAIQELSELVITA